MLWINPNNPEIFIEGNDGGATVTLNGGKAWSSEDNQPTGQFYHANLDDQFPFHIYGAQQDRGSDEGPSAVPAGRIPPVWKNIQGGEMSWVVPTPGQPWVTYGSGYYSMEWKENRRTGLITNVSPWPEYKFGLAGSEIKYRYGWNHHPVVFAPGNPNELLMGANVLFETMDEGIHWKVISPDLTRNDKSKQGRPGGPISADVTGEEMFDTISSIAFSPLTDNVIWTGSDDGLVYVTTDAGGHWSQVRPPTLPTWSTITCIEPSHTDAGTAYVSASRFDWDDFHPYVYKTTDYGKHWTQITAGLPEDQYVESVRQDPDESRSALRGHERDGVLQSGRGPAVAAVDPQSAGRAGERCGDPARATRGGARHFRARVLGARQPAVPGAVGRRAGGGRRALPVQAAAGVAGHTPYGRVRPAGAGRRESGARSHGVFPPAGRLQRQHAREAELYRRKRQADPQLHAAPENERQAGAAFGQPRRGAKATGRKATAIEPGMNHFQWDLTYPDAVDVKGIYNSFFAAAPPIGPEVVPGTYYVTLTYGHTTQKQPFVVKLDPRLQTTQAELQQRFDLLMRIHDALNRLDTNLNQAIDARDALEKAVANKSVSGHQAQSALDRLNRDIDDLVDLKIQSGEGALVYPGRLRSWLTSIAGQVSMAFVPPTPAMVQVADGYIDDAGAGVSRLQSDVAAANKVLNH